MNIHANDCTDICSVSMQTKHKNSLTGMFLTTSRNDWIESGARGSGRYGGRVFVVACSTCHHRCPSIGQTGFGRNAGSCWCRFCSCSLAIRLLLLLLVQSLAQPNVERLARKLEIIWFSNGYACSNKWKNVKFIVIANLPVSNVSLQAFRIGHAKPWWHRDAFPQLPFW